MSKHASDPRDQQMRQEAPPHQAIGKITPLAPGAYSPARSIYGDDVLSLNYGIAFPNIGR